VQVYQFVKVADLERDKTESVGLNRDGIHLGDIISPKRSPAPSAKAGHKPTVEVSPPPMSTPIFRPYVPIQKVQLTT
jgi:hypothetical protein